MPAASEIYQRLWQLFYRPASLQEVMEGYHQIDQLAEAGKLEHKEAAELKARAFGAMQEATSDRPALASTPILKFLVPECLRGSRDGKVDIRETRWLYRERLRDWLDSLDESVRLPIRSEVISQVLDGLATGEPDLACYTFSILGYRDPLIVESLWSIADRHSDRLGDIAVSTLSALGLPTPERQRLVQTVQTRAENRCNIHLIAAMRKLRDPAFLDAIEQHWLPANDPDSWPNESLFVLPILADIAEKAADRTDLSDRVWDLLMRYHHAASRNVDRRLYLGSDLAPRCNSNRVIPDLLEELLTPSDGSENSEIRRFQLHRRLEGCVRPRQLEGWISPFSETTLQVLRHDATCDTGLRGAFITRRMDLKESAWRALLSHGDPAMVDEAIFEEAVGAETSPFVRDRITDFLACFRFDRLPRTAIRSVSERIDIGQKDATEELVSRSAATKLLRSTATRQAFEVLLRFGFTFNGAVLRESADAVLDVAFALVREGDLTIGPELAEVAIRGGDRRNRVVALETLTHLVALGLVPVNVCTGLAETLADESRDKYERSRIVEALGVLPEEFISPLLEQQIVSWASGGDELALRSLEALARQDRLLAYPELLTTRLCLRKVGDRWDLLPTTTHPRGLGFVLGLLHERHPELFIDAVCSFVRNCDWVYAAGLLHFFGGMGGPQREVTAELKDALIDRIKSRQSGASTETELFGILRAWDAVALACLPWGDYWQDWLPDARAALADSLGDLGPEVCEEAAAHLLALTKDGSFAVRRSAYRSLGRISPNSLLALCQASVVWGDPPDLEPPPGELRRRAAEACALAS